MDHGEQGSIRALVPSNLLGQRRGLEQLVPRLLEPGESPLAIASCVYAGRWWQDFRNSRVIVVTDIRLVFVPTGIVSTSDIARQARYPEPESLPFTEIQRIDVDHGGLHSKLNLVTGTRTIRLKGMRAQGALDVALAVRHHSGDPPPDQPVA
jgi:Bacterial PH domain